MSTNAHVHGAAHSPSALAPTLEAIFERYRDTEQWLESDLEWLAPYRSDARLWAVVCEVAAANRVHPDWVEAAVDDWLRAHPAAALDPASRPVLQPLAEVKAEAVRWLWEPYVPLGKLTLLEGDPEAGKTWLALSLAAALTTGQPLPGSPLLVKPMAAPRTVIYMQAEDGLADTIRPRFDAAGGNPHRLLMLRGKLAPKSEREEPLSLRDLDIIEAVMLAHQPALLIIDPLQAYLGAHVDMHRANQTRPLMAGLARLAEQHGCAILCIRHLSKARQDRAIYQGLGSIDFAAAARSVLLVGFHPDDATGTQRVLAHSKSSLAPRGPSLGYAIDGGQLVWSGLPDVSVEQLLHRPPDADEQGVLAEAMQFLSDLLADGAVPTRDVFREGKAVGLSEITLRRAKARLGVSAAREGREQAGRGRGQWVWRLPEA